MTDPCKNNAFAGLERGDTGGFSANQSKLWHHGQHSYFDFVAAGGIPVSQNHKHMSTLTNEYFFLANLGSSANVIVSYW